MPISYPSSYNYTDLISGPSNPNPSASREPTEWYIEMEERHNDEVRQLELEAGMHEMEISNQQDNPARQHDRRANLVIPRVRATVEEGEVQSANIVCFCGFEALQLVVRHGKDVGRRYYTCPVRNNGCEFGQWIDDRFPRRAITYALELEEEIRKLRNQVNDLSNSNYRLQRGLN